MIAKRFEELICWQRMNELSIEVWKMTDRAPFANFLDFSRASALETKALLKKGLSVGYWTQDEFQRVDTLANRGLQTVARLQRYLRSPQAKRNAAHRYRKQRRAQNDPNESNVTNDPNESNDPNVPR